MEWKRRQHSIAGEYMILIINKLIILFGPQ